MHLHPIEVKIGLNDAGVIEKAKGQIINTHNGLLHALWPDGEERNITEDIGFFYAAHFVYGATSVWFGRRSIPSFAASAALASE